MIETKNFLNTRRIVQAAFALACGLAVTSASAAVVPFLNRALFQTAAPASTGVIDFERGLAPATSFGGDFLPTFTQLGYVTFVSQPNYRQEIIEGLNVNQSGNDVYLTLASDKTKNTADVLFGNGVLSFGFDFKNSSSAGTAQLVPQSFTFTLFSGATNLGSFSVPTLVGSSFQFLGFTSTVPITELTAIAVVPGASPNLDLVLDNFLVAAQVAAPSAVPEPGVLPVVGLGLVGMVAIRARKGAKIDRRVRTTFA